MKSEIRVVDTVDGFYNLKEDWNELYDTCQNVTIFLSWDWMFTWWEVFSKALNSKLFILCFYENNKLVGLAPFHIIYSFPKSLIQGQTLSFIGCGEEVNDKIVSQYADFIVKPGNKTQMISLISEYLYNARHKWDFADFPFLLENSIVADCFKSQGYKIYSNISQYGNRFYIPAMTDFDDFLDKMGNRWSKMYKKKSRKLDNDGAVRIQLSDEDSSVKSAFAELSDMHEARWKSRTDINIFKSKLFNEFHLKILERLAPQKKVSINTLYLDEKPLASYYYFKDKSQLHYYQSGFYAEHANRYSPLFLLVCKEIEQSIDNKITFDFMFDERPDSYKQEQYAAKSKPMYRLKWSPYKSRMLKHRYAKLVQTKYLKLKKPLKKLKKNSYVLPIIRNK